MIRSKILIGGSIATLGMLVAAGIRSARRHPVGNPDVPEPAKPVELNRYLGQWYEIARYDQGFEVGCEGVTATYSPREDGRINVLNRCRKANGRVREIRGVAEIADPASSAKLKVSFYWPIRGDYWVLDHAEDYRWSIVGESSGRFLWILAREATPAASEVDRLINRAQAIGYDTDMLVRTVQP